VKRILRWIDPFTALLPLTGALASFHAADLPRCKSRPLRPAAYSKPAHALMAAQGAAQTVARGSVVRFSGEPRRQKLEKSS
jgi:hypothetical protein